MQRRLGVEVQDGVWAANEARLTRFSSFLYLRCVAFCIGVDGMSFFVCLLSCAIRRTIFFSVFVCRVSSKLLFVSEASSRDPFVFSTLRQPRCIEWMALVDLMVTL